MQYIGETQDGKHLLRMGDGNIYEFSTETEVAQAMSRLATAQVVVGCVQALAPIMDNAPDVWQEFWDVTNAGGSYTDEELEPLGITADQLASCITVLENFNKMMNNEAVAVNSYRTTINLMRRIPGVSNVR